MSTAQFDIVVAGGGHNSLVTAAYLAKAGYSCLILEARPVIGGDTTTEELTLPGFRHDTCSTSHAIFMESPIWRDQELPLAEYGLEYIQTDPASHVVFADGSCHGGDLSPAQSETLRPVPGFAQHRMPIPGLYQTGATTHPGGSVTGAPGRNAAMVLLQDLGRSWNEVIQAK